jgi:hypothetical protein
MAVKFLAAFAVTVSVGEAKRIIHLAQEFEDRCCCSESEPLMKYVCIDRDDSSHSVYSPASLTLLEKPIGGESIVLDPPSVDKDIMGTPTSDSDMALLTDAEKIKRSIPTKARTVSQCSETGGVEDGSAEWIAGSEDAVQLKYVGKQWNDYQVTGAFKYYKNTTAAHVLIDGVVYTESDTKLDTENRAICIQTENSAYLKYDMFSGSSDPKCHSSGPACHQYAFSSACGWGEKVGALYKRVGRMGSCLSSAEQREVSQYGLFGKKHGKCPKDMYHSVNSKSKAIRGKGWLFCDCGDTCK